MAKKNFSHFLTDRKGQEFSVFKLLISAVIAVVILGLLLSIVNSIIITGQGDPAEEAGKTVKAIMRENSRLGSSNEVTFKKGTTINNRNISGATGGVIQSNEVCISAGDFKENANWTVNDSGTLLEYTGSDDIKAKLVAACDSVAVITDSSQYGDVVTYMSEVFGSSLSGDDFQECGCLEDTGANRCCFVAVKRT